MHSLKSSQAKLNLYLQTYGGCRRSSTILNLRIMWTWSLVALAMGKRIPRFPLDGGRMGPRTRLSLPPPENRTLGLRPCSLHLVVVLPELARLCAMWKPRQSYIMTDSQSTSLSWCQAPIWDPWPNFPLSSIIIFRHLWVVYVGHSLTRSRVCIFQFLLGMARAVFFGSESHGTHERILFSIFF
jgi:hypothetical protein